MSSFVVPAVVGAVTCALGVLVRRPGARAVGPGLAGLYALILFGFAVHLTWFPSRLERLQTHGAEAGATIVRVTAWNGTPVYAFPFLPGEAETVRGASAVEVRYSTPSEEVTATVDVRDDMDVETAQEWHGEDIKGTELHIVYDRGHPRTAMPKDAVDFTPGRVKAGWELAGVFALISLAGFAILAVLAFLSRSERAVEDDDRTVARVDWWKVP